MSLCFVPFFDFGVRIPLGTSVDALVGMAPVSVRPTPPCELVGVADDDAIGLEVDVTV